MREGQAPRTASANRFILRSILEAAERVPVGCMRLTGRKYMIIATLLFSIMTLIVKSLGRIPAIEVAFFRGFVAFLACAALLYFLKIRALGKNKKWLFIRGLFGTCGLVCYFTSLQNIPLATAITIANLSPLFTILFSGLFFGEAKPVRKFWLLLMIAFTGVLLIKGFDTRIGVSDLGIALLGMLSASLAYNSVRRLNRTEHPLVIVFYFSWMSTALLAPIAAAQWVVPSEAELFAMIVIGFVVLASQFCLTKAYQLEAPARVSYLDHLSVVYGLFAGYFIFGEHIRPESLVGMGLIAMAVFGAYKLSSRARTNSRDPERETALR